MSTAQNPVTAEAGNSSATIHARVGASAIDKATRLFSAGLADIFTLCGIATTHCRARRNFA